MKTRIICTVVVAIMALTIAGCPPTDPTIGGPSDDDGLPPIFNLFGRVVASGNLYDSSSQTKALHTWVEIGDTLKSKIDHIKIYFSEDPNYPSDTYAYEDPFTIMVDTDGNYYGEFSIIPAHYTIWAYAYQENGMVLFEDSVYLNVLHGQTTTLNILFAFLDSYLYTFRIDGLPGDYPNTGDVIITDNLNRQYIATYQKNAVGNLIFSAYLPLDFDGETASMEMIDSGGTSYLTDLNFDITHAVEGLIVVSYTGGSITIDIGFEYE